MQGRSQKEQREEEEEGLKRRKVGSEKGGTGRKEGQGGKRRTMKGV